MRVLFTVAFCLVAGAAGALAGETEIYLLRHAEKQSGVDDPPLTRAGQERALELAERFADRGLAAIHSSNYRRTLATVAPLAKRAGLAITLYDPRDPNALVAAITQSGGRHLVVGHSNTVPQLVERLGGAGGTPIDEADEYDRLYVVTRFEDGRVRTELLRYGVRVSP